MAEDFEIKPLSLELVEAASTVIMASFNQFLGPGLDEEARAVFETEVARPQQLRAELAAGEIILVACVAEEVAGVISMFGPRHLKVMFLDAAYHGRGIAKSLWREARRICLEKYPSEEPFTLNSSDYAVEVYRKWGFRDSGPRQTKKGLVFTPMRLPVSEG